MEQFQGRITCVSKNWYRLEFTLESYLSKRDLLLLVLFQKIKILWKGANLCGHRGLSQMTCWRLLQLLGIYCQCVGTTHIRRHTHTQKLEHPCFSRMRLCSPPAARLASPHPQIPLHGGDCQGGALCRLMGRVSPQTGRKPEQTSLSPHRSRQPPPSPPAFQEAKSGN